MKECLVDRIRKEPSDYFDPYYDYNICVLGLVTRPLKPRKPTKEKSRGATSEIASENPGMKLLKNRIRTEVDSKNRNEDSDAEVNGQIELFSQN